MIPLALTASLAAPIGHMVCVERSTAIELAAALHGAEVAYTAMDLDGFVDRRDLAADLLGCLGETLGPMDVASYHRVMALDGFLEDDSERTVAAFRAVLAIQPDLQLPSMLAMPGNPLWDLFEQAKVPTTVEMTHIYPPAGSVLYVDGVVTTERPVGRPVLVELQSVGGGVLWAGYLGAGVENPDWTVLDLSIPADPSRKSRLALERVGPSRPLLYTSTGLAVVAGGLYATAWVMGQRYDDPDNPDIEAPGDLDRLQQRTNTLVWVSAGTGGAAVLLGALSFLDTGPAIGWSWRW
jgi:hypothetical protein